MRAFLSTVAVAVIVVSTSDAADPQNIACARVFPNAGQLGLFIAAADGSNEHPLLTDRDLDYDPVRAPDGASIVFTSDQRGVRLKRCRRGFRHGQLRRYLPGRPPQRSGATMVSERQCHHLQRGFL